MVGVVRLRQGDSGLEPGRTSVPFAGKEVSRHWFWGKFNFRNLKFEVQPGYPNLIPLLNLVSQRLQGHSITSVQLLTRHLSYLAQWEPSLPTGS